VSPFVLDASVAVKWFLPAKDETLAEEALGLLDQYVREEIDLLVPDLFWVECASVAWKAVRVGRLPLASANDALTALIEYDFPTVPSPSLLSTAFQIATTFRRTIYDSIYVALALKSKAQLVTADERLVNSLAAHFPVRWLGAL
jgi:predicted nucleic acid-binding protein